MNADPSICIKCRHAKSDMRRGPFDIDKASCFQSDTFIMLLQFKVISPETCSFYLEHLMLAEKSQQ